MWIIDTRNFSFFYLFILPPLWWDLLPKRPTRSLYIARQSCDLIHLILSLSSLWFSSHIAKQASCMWDTSVNKESLFILPTLDLYIPTHLVSIQVSLAWIEKYLALHIALQAEEGLLPATSDDSWGSFSSSVSSLVHTCRTHRETSFGTVNVILHESSQSAVSLSESSLSYESTGISTSFFFRLMRSSEDVVQADCTHKNLSFTVAYVFKHKVTHVAGFLGNPTVGDVFSERMFCKLSNFSGDS